jgi:hypothetical protein
VKFRIHLFGRHSHRTPLSYPDYRPLLERYFEFAARSDEADFLVVGYRNDIIDNARAIRQIHIRRPRQRVVVLSEEPLWDTLWSGDFRQHETAVATEAGTIAYTALNHFTTRIYLFRRLPYFVTSTDDFFLRYRHLLLRNREMSLDALAAHLRTTPIHNAFFCERRVEERFVPKSPGAAGLGLSVYRSRAAEALNAVPVALRVGKGWHGDRPRQALPDWHLDKIAALDRRSRFTSAIENTIVPSYITEKLFDAYATLSVPLYVAPPDHFVHRLVPPPSFVNLDRVPAERVAQRLESWDITPEFLHAYRDTQRSLAALFGDPAALHAERVRVVSEIADEFAALAASPGRGL